MIENAFLAKCNCKGDNLSEILTNIVTVHVTNIQDLHTYIFIPKAFQVFQAFQVLQSVSSIREDANIIFYTL